MVCDGSCADTINAQTTELIAQDGKLHDARHKLERHQALHTQLVNCLVMVVRKWPADENLLIMKRCLDELCRGDELCDLESEAPEVLDETYLHELNKIKDQRRAEIAALEQDLAAHEGAVLAMQTQRAALAQEQLNLQVLVDENRAARASEEARHAVQLRDLLAQNGAAIAAAIHKHETDMQQLHAKNSDEIRDLRKSHEDLMLNTRTTMQKEQTEHGTAHAAEVADILAQNKAELAQIRDRNRAELAQIRDRNKAELAQIRDRNKAELTQIREESNAEMAALRAKHSAELEQLHSAHKTALAADKEQHKQDTKRAKDRMTADKKRHAADLQQMQAQHAADVQDLHEAAENASAALQGAEAVSAVLDEIEVCIPRFMQRFRANEAVNSSRNRMHWYILARELMVQRWFAWWRAVFEQRRRLWAAEQHDHFCTFEGFFYREDVRPWHYPMLRVPAQQGRDATQDDALVPQSRERTPVLPDALRRGKRRCLSHKPWEQWPAALLSWYSIESSMRAIEADVRLAEDLLGQQLREAEV